MRQSTITFGVTKDHAIPIEPPLGGTALVANLSGATLNVADDSQVTVDTSTITVGSSATFTNPAFMKSQGSLSTVQVTLTDASGVSSLTVTDGTTPVANPSTLSFLSGATVSSPGGGVAGVTVSGGGGIAGAYSSTTTDQVYYVSKTGSDSTGNGTLGAPFLTIGAALDAANATSNGTAKIKVGAGGYHEEVWVTKAVTLEADGGTPGFGYHKATTIIAPSDSKNCINVVGTSANGTIIRDFGTQGASTTWTGVGINIAGASQVKVKQWAHTNQGQTPSRAVGGIGIAISHSEECEIDGYSIGDSTRAIVLGTNSEDPHFLSGSLGNNYGDRFGGWYEGFRVPLALSALATDTSLSINNSVGLNKQSSAFAIISDPLQACAAVGLTGVFTATAHGYSNGDQVLLAGTNGGSLFPVDIPYFVVNVTTNTFQLASTSISSAIVGGTDLTAGFVYRTEGLWYSSITAGQPGTITGALRATVGYLSAAINNSQTTGISIIPLSQGNSQAGDVWGNSYTKPLTAIPSSGSITLDGGGTAETISYTSLTDNGDGSYTLAGTVTRGGSPVSHSAKAPAQDQAQASAAAHAAGAMVIQSPVPSGMAGIFGAGALLEKYKAVSCWPQAQSDMVEDWWGGGNVFLINDRDESSNTNIVRFRPTSTHNKHISVLTAPVESTSGGGTLVIDEGAYNSYELPMFGQLVFGRKSYRCRVETNGFDPFLFGTVVVDQGIGNELSGESQGPRPDNAAASGTAVDVLRIPGFTPLNLFLDKSPDTTFAPKGTNEQDVFTKDFGTLNVSGYNNAGSKNAMSRMVAAVFVQSPGPFPAYQMPVVPGTSSTTNNGSLLFWADGGVPTDQFTMVLFVTPDPKQAVELFNFSAANDAVYLSSGSGVTNQFMQVGMGTGSKFQVVLTNNETSASMGGANNTLSGQITLTAPQSGTCTQATSGSPQVTAYSGTVAPTVGTMIVGCGIYPQTYITAVSGSSGNYSLTLSATPFMALTGNMVNISDCPLNVPLAATISASGTTTNGSASIAYTGATPPAVGTAATGPGIPLGSYVSAPQSGSTGAYTITINNTAGSGAGTGTVTFSDDYYPAQPWMAVTVIWDQNNVQLPGGTNLVLLLGDNRKNVTKALPYNITATGTCSGTSVTGWAGGTIPTVGLMVTGPGVLSGTRVIGTPTGSGPFAFSTNRPLPSGSVSLTLQTPLMPRPWASQIGQSGTGLAMATNGATSKNLNASMQFSRPVVYRYARNYTGLPASNPTIPATATTNPPNAPCISVDLATTSGSFPVRLGGSSVKLAGHGNTEANETSPLIRNQQITTLVKAGFLVRRDDNLELRAPATVRCWAGTVSGISGSQFTLTQTTTNGAGSGVTYASPAVGDTVAFTPYSNVVATIQNVTGTGPFTITLSGGASVPGGATSAGGGNVALSSTADLDVKWDRWHYAYGGSAGFAAPTAYQVSWTAGWNPTALNGGVSGNAANSVPNVTGLQLEAATALWSLWASLVVTYIQARYPTHLMDVTFWNEPENSTFSPSITSTQFGQWWSRASGQIAADQGATGLRLSGVDGQYVNQTAGQVWQNAIFSQAAADGRVLPAIRFHNYSGDRASLLEEVLALSNAAAGQGFTPKVQAGEYNLGNSGAGALPWEPSQWNNDALAMVQAAWVLDVIAHWQAAGVDFASYFTAAAASGSTVNAAVTSNQILIEDTAIPRLAPAGIAMSAYWKHGGKLLSNVSSNWVGLRALGSSNGQLKTITYSSLRLGSHKEVLPFQFNWTNLPTKGYAYVCTVSGGTTVTGWPGIVEPRQGMPVSGGGLAAGTTVQGPISGSTGNWNFSLSSAATNGTQTLTVQVPAPFTWKEFRYDFRDVGEPRLSIVREGNQSNLPDGSSLTGCGFGVLQIYT